MERRSHGILTESGIARFSFAIIRFMHDNPLVRSLRNPLPILESLGVERGGKVLEIGCGPGFFTFPAARLVGDSGRIYALDVNPYAVRHVKKRAGREPSDNIEVLHANAADTTLPDGNIDLAFFIGVPHIAGGLKPVIEELGRVLKPDGKISFHLGRRPEASLEEEMAACGFKRIEADGLIRIFQKESAAHERLD